MHFKDDIEIQFTNNTKLTRWEIRQRLERWKRSLPIFVQLENVEVEGDLIITLNETTPEQNHPHILG